MSVVKLGAICSLYNGGAWSQNDFSETGYPVLKVSNCKPSGFVTDDISYIPFEIAEKSEINKLHKGDVIIATVGSHPNLVESAAGRSCVVNDTVVGYYLNQNAVCLRSNDLSILDQRYLGYLAESAAFKHYIQSRGKGAANQMRIAIGAIKEYMFELPSIAIQRKIASFLSTYDDLIENNQKQIKLLEEAAQRLYKEWFVDLRFPGHETTPIINGTPEGWQKLSFGEIVAYEIGGGWGEDEPTGKCESPAYVIRGTDIDGIKRGELLQIPHRYHQPSNLASRILQDGDIIFEVSGGSKNTGVAKTLLLREELLEIWQEPVMCASFCKLIRFVRPDIPQYAYDTLQYWRATGTTEEFEKKSASSIINYRWKDFLEQQQILIPSNSLLAQYNSVSSALYKSIIAHSKSIEKAKEARDRLLPKLMNGKTNEEHKREGFYVRQKTAYPLSLL